MIDAGRLGNVPETAAAVVLEQHVAFADRGDEEILVAVVVDVRERGGDADSARQADARFRGDVPEPAAAGVLVKPAAADLVDEIEIDQAVAVHVGRGEAGSVVVVDRLVVDRGVFHDGWTKVIPLSATRSANWKS